MERILVDQNSHTALAGEVYEFTFRTIGVPFIDKFQQDLIKKKIVKNPKLEVIHIDGQRGFLIVRVLVVENPLPLVMILSTITTASIGLFVWLSLTKVEQIINTPEGKTSNFATSIGLAVGVLSLGLLFKGK